MLESVIITTVSEIYGLDFALSRSHPSKAPRLAN